MLEDGTSTEGALMAREARAGVRGDEPGRATHSAPRTVLVTACDSAWGGKMVGALQRLGIPSLQGSTPAQTLYWARRVVPALVLLDLRVDGWRPLMRGFRREGRIVLALTDDAGTRADALEGGCLDSVPTGVGAEELALKVASLLRQRWGSGGGRITAGPLVVDLSARCLLWRGSELAVSPLLLNLAAYLAAHPGRILPTRVLLEEVWGEPWAAHNKVHQAVWRLRSLLGETADSSFLIGRQWHGYGLFPDAVPIAARRQLAGL
jgi:DNA-binding response OmpR family regulator